MWFIGVEVEQETSAPPPKKNPGSVPELPSTIYLCLINRTQKEAKTGCNRFGFFLCPVDALQS